MKLSWEQNSNTFWTILFSIAFIAISFYAIYNALLTAEQERKLQQEQARKELASLWKLWEKNIFVQLDSWHSTMETQKNPEQFERIWKRQVPWLQDIYLWKKDNFIYPLVEWNTVNAPCLKREKTWIKCRTESEEVQNRASLLRGKNLLLEGQISEAHFAVLSGLPSLKTNTFELNLSHSGIRDFFLRRNLLYKTELLNAPQNGGRALLGRTLQDLNSLPAIYLESFLEDIDVENINLSEESQQQIEKQQRRFESFQEIQTLQQEKIDTDWKIHISSYQENPNLILLQTNKNEETIAFVLESFTLLQELTQEASHLSNLNVVNANGDPIFPYQYNEPLPSSIVIQVPGNQLFPHLRLEVHHSPKSKDIWGTLMNQLIPIGIAGTLGIIALFGAFQAERKQQEFIARQQAFIARVTHELKTPLAGIQLMAESLQMGMTQDPKQAEQFVKRILVETSRLEKRIDEVLQVAKKAEMKKKELIDAEMLMLELYDVWNDRFKEVGGTLRLERSPLEFYGDLELIQDAISNLLSNAIKYRHPNRTLRCIFAIEQRGSWVEISVADNGIGVPLSDRKRIFERFVRVESNHRGFAGGHGLGLAFVAETAQAHKGSVRCTDGLNGGVKFAFRVPRS